MSVSDTPLRSGAPASCTLTMKPPLPTLPARSLTVHVTAVGPSGKIDPEIRPDAEAHVGSSATPDNVSVASAEKNTAAPSGPDAGTVRSVAITNGGVVSI